MRNETSFLLGVSQKTQEMRDGKRGKGKSIADRSKDPRVESFSSTYFCKQVKDNKGLKGRVARISYVWFTRDKCLGWLKPWQHIYCYFVNFLKINFKLLVFTSFVSISHWLQVQNHPVKHLIDYRWPVVMWAWLSVVIGNTHVLVMARTWTIRPDSQFQLVSFISFVLRDSTSSSTHYQSLSCADSRVAVRSLTGFSGEDSRTEKSGEPAGQQHPDSEHEALLSLKELS